MSGLWRKVNMLKQGHYTNNLSERYHFLMSLSVILIFLIGCKSNTEVPPALITKDTTNPRERANTLFVFVGERLNVEEVPWEKGMMDTKIKARYKVLESVYGECQDEVIDFVAYDHYGIPPFIKYKHVLMYLSRNESGWYMEKYMYDPLFRTKDGRWAGPYSDDYDHPNNKGTTIQPEKTSFEEKVGFSVKFVDENKKECILSFPSPYFNQVGDSAFAVYGNYVIDLFRLKKEGVLKARELF